jgi:hypothetical protein
MNRKHLALPTLRNPAVDPGTVTCLASQREPRCSRTDYQRCLVAPKQVCPGRAATRPGQKSKITQKRKVTES